MAESTGSSGKATVDREEHERLQREHERLKTMYARLHAAHEDLEDEHAALKEKVYDISKQFQAATSKENLNDLMQECFQEPARRGSRSPPRGS